MTGLSAVIGGLGLVIVDALDVRRAGGSPAETDAALTVDADAVLAGAIPLQGFKAIPRRHAEVIASPVDLQLAQLASRHGGDTRDAPGPAAAGECLRIGIPERDDRREQ